MRLTLLLGSGISLATGLPSVNKLTAQLFEANSGSGSHSSSTPEVRYEQSRIRDLLTTLREYDEHFCATAGSYLTHDGAGYGYSGAIYRGGTTYEDLYTLCGEISDYGHGLADSAAAGALVEAIESRAGDFLEGDSTQARIFNLGCLATRASAYINETITAMLHAPKSIGLELIVELARTEWVDRLDIVTLNHDTLVEQTLSDSNVSFVDGFSAPDGDVRYYDDTLFDAVSITTRVTKIHGSINWHQYSREGGTCAGIFVGVDPSNCRNAAGEEVRRYSTSPKVLTGLGKPVSYNRDIYADMHFQFHRVLRENEIIVMSGYGWGDLAVNHQLEAWLQRSRQNRIILLHKNPEHLRERSMLLDGSLDRFIEQRRIVSITTWLSDTRLKQLEPHLRSSPYGATGNVLT